MGRAVVIFDANLISPALGRALEVYHFEAKIVPNEGDAIDIVETHSPELVVLAIDALSAAEAVRTAGRVRAADSSCSVLMLGSDVSKEVVLAALRAGVTDIVEATSEREIFAAVGNCAARGRHPIQPELDLLGGDKMAGNSQAIREIRRQIGQVAPTDANVLITGESGTGKELVAALIHRNSRRQVKPFVSINCAAIPEALLESELFGHERGAFTGAHTQREGKLQHACGGTLFLDEVGDMSLLSQAKILRAIETRVIQRLGSNVETPIEIRLIAATNQDLESYVDEKRFRQDLYFRLNVVRIHLPPLRDRLEDIPELTEHILDDLSRQYPSPCRRIEGDVLRRLQMHDWPGNIRELRNVIESIIVFSPSRNVAISDVPAHIRQRLCHSTSDFGGQEKSNILNALNSTEWNRGKAAEILRCSRMTLYRKMVKHRIA